MKKDGEMQFILRISTDLVKRLDYVAAYYGRSRNSEIVWALRQYVADFEKSVDKIEDPQKL